MDHSSHRGDIFDSTIDKSKVGGHVHESFCVMTTVFFIFVFSSGR